MWSATKQERQPAIRLLDEGWARLVENASRSDIQSIESLTQEVKTSVLQGLKEDGQNYQRALDFNNPSSQHNYKDINKAESEAGQALLLWIKERHGGNETVINLLKNSPNPLLRNNNNNEDALEFNANFTTNSTKGKSKRNTKKELIKWEQQQFQKALKSATNLPSLSRVSEEFNKWLITSSDASESNKNKTEAHHELLDVLDSCFLTLNQLLVHLRADNQEVDSKSTEIVIKLMSIVKQGENVPGLQTHSIERIKYLTIAVLDLLGIDEMRVAKRRENKEIDKIRESIESHISKDSKEELSPQAIAVDYKRRYGREEDDRKNRSDGQEQESLQDRVFKSISNGVPFIVSGGVVPVVSSDEIVIEGEWSQEKIDKELGEVLSMLGGFKDKLSDKYYARKMIAFLRSSEMNPEGYLEKHIRHYEKFFELSDGSQPEVILTNSGARANEAVIKSLSRAADLNAAHFQQGWYYENETSITTGFDLNGPSNAQVLFLNVDASYQIEPQKYRKQQEQLITDFIQKAKLEPHTQHVMVVDATSDLLVDPTTKFGALPDNLLFIKTFSGTKHQRGGQNYFYGGIAIYGGSEPLIDEIESSDKFWAEHHTRSSKKHGSKNRKRMVKRCF